MLCPACSQKIESKPCGSYNGYKLYHCHVCDVMFWHPMKSPGSEWYDASSLVAGRELAQLKPTREVFWAHERFFQDSPAREGKLLDVGCGAGEFLTMAQQAGYLVTGIDFSQKTIEMVSSQLGLKDVYPYTLEELISQKPNVKYDVIVFFELLEHLDNVQDFLDSVRKLLQPGGFVALSVPNRERWRYGSRKFFCEEWDYPPNHLTRWNTQALVNLFTSHDFSVYSVEVEPIKASDWAWDFFVSHKLGIHPLVFKFARKVLIKGGNSGSMPRKSGFINIVAKLGATSYLEAFVPFLGMITLPLRLLVRKQGINLYLLARLQT